MSLTMDPAAAMALQSELLDVKHTSDAAMLYPNHGHARGGVGHFLATGARAGLNKLPQARHSSASGSRLPSRTGSATSTSYSQAYSYALDPAEAEAVAAAEATAAREWERGTVRHPHNFVSSSRTVRPWDVPAGSRWASVSFFENDPREIRRHMQITDWIQATHEQGKAIEQQTEQARHAVWAQKQREMFRRQRLEQAAKYTQAGMRPRSAYAEIGATAAAEEVHGASFTSRLPPAARDFFRSAASLASTSGSMAGPYLRGGRGRPATAMSLSGLRSHSVHGATLKEAAAMAATMSSGGASAAGGSAAAIPLPKQTFTKVTTRMAQEALEVPAAKAKAVAAAKAKAEEEKKQAGAVEDMQSLDVFEAHMRALQKARSRSAQQSNGNRKPSGFSDADDIVYM